MGMLATVMNALALQDALEQPRRLHARHVARSRCSRSPSPTSAAARSATWRRAASSSSPPAPATRTSRPTRPRRCARSRSTPTCIMKATKVDGVYDADPKTQPRRRQVRRARPTSTCSTGACRSWTARRSRCAWTTTCRSSSSTWNVDGNIERALKGEPVGTIVRGDDSMTERHHQGRRRAHGEDARRRCSHEFATVRTGRASAALFEKIHGRRTTARRRRCNQVADVKAPEPQTARHRAVGQVGHRRDREGDPRLRPRPEPEQRRHRHPRARSRRSPRSAAGSSSSCARATPRRHASPCATSAATPTTSSSKLEKDGEIVRGRRPPRRGRGPEAHRRPRQGDRRAAQAQRSRDHGGLAGRDSGRIAPEPSSSTASAAAELLGEFDPGTRARARRHHHGRQRPLGREARAAAPRRPPRRREGRPRGHRRRDRARRPLPHHLLVLLGELEPARATRSSGS